MGFRVIWLPQENKRVDIILRDLCPKLLLPPSGPARYLCTFRFVTSSIRRPVVPVAYRLFLLRIPLYAIQKFCIRVFFESCAIKPMFIVLLSLFIFFWLKTDIKYQPNTNIQTY